MTLWISTVIQVLVLSVLFYYVFLFFRGTRGAQVLVGLVLLLVVLMGVTRVVRLDVLNFILRGFFVYLALALLIIFQPEIRRALAELGRQPAMVVSADRRTVVDYLVHAVSMLAEHRVGALIAVEREIGTRGIQESGTRIDARLEPHLLASIFFPHTPLHDGGVVLQGNRIVAAGCVFPLSHDIELQKKLGTRHRAAVGLSEETDAVVIVVSEETGTISVAYRGRLSQGLDQERLKRFLTALLLREKRGESTWRRVQKTLDLTPEGIAQSENLSKKEAEES